MSSDLNQLVEQGLKVAGDPSMTDAYKQALASAGIDPAQIPEAPDPGPAVEPISLEEVVNESPTSDKVRKESLPMRLLDWYVQDGGGKYAGYKSFMVLDVWHPTLGRKLLTHSFERTDGSLTPVGRWVKERMKKGDVFKVGEVGTNRGFTVFRPISVV